MHVLKEKIVKKYGTKAAFAQPFHMQSEYLYNASMNVQDVLESFLRTCKDTQNSEENTDDESEMKETDENLMYHCGTLLHNIIKNMDVTMQWPPKPEDISKESIDVPDELFNLIAYMMTGTQKPVSI